MRISEGHPQEVDGPPFERGQAIARLGAGHARDVRERAALAAPLVAEAAEWVAAQWRAQMTHLPEMAGLVEGMAAGFGLETRALFGAHLRYALEDRKLATPELDPDGCSTFAIRTDSGNVLVAKNRDNPPDLRPRQLLLRQRDPAWGGREILCVGTFGSVPGASSGMNSDGFCMTDTAVRAADLGIGALRYYLMEALLVRCADVAEALAMIRAMPHLGGGNLVLGDASGRIALVEIGHSRLHVEEATRGWVARTNHHLDPVLAPRLMNAPDSGQGRNSRSRLDLIETTLSRGTAGWGEEECATLLASRGDATHDALCRDTPTTLTLSGVVFDARARTALLSHGAPCEGDWRRSTLAPGTLAH